MALDKSTVALNYIPHSIPQKGFYLVPCECKPVVRCRPNNNDVMKFKDYPANQFFRKKTYRQGRRSQRIYWETVNRDCDHGQGRLLEPV